jgi:hypothetical protein
MPRFVKTIDQIARETQRDVLWIRFLDFHHRDGRVDGPPDKSEWDTPVRRRVLEVLEANGIAWMPCLPWLDDGWLAYSYEGDVYVNVPRADDNLDFQKLSALLEKDQQGTPAVDGAWLCAFALDGAMRYAYRDEPSWNDNP